MVARGFPRCKPNRIPDKMPEDKMLENKMSENGKPDKMPDNLTRTLTGSGPFVSVFTHTHSLSISLHTLYLSLLINTFLSCCTHSISTSLYRYTHSLSLSFSKHTPSLSLHTLSIFLTLYLSLPVRSLGPYMYVHYCTCIVHILV